MTEFLHLSHFSSYTLVDEEDCANRFLYRLRLDLHNYLVTSQFVIYTQVIDYNKVMDQLTNGEKKVSVIGPKRPFNNVSEGSTFETTPARSIYFFSFPRKPFTTIAKSPIIWWKIVGCQKFVLGCRLAEYQLLNCLTRKQAKKHHILLFLNTKESKE